jgi:hypothetical protein
MCAPTQSGHDLFRILLYRNDATELLLEIPPHGLRLPTVPVPTHTRVAEEVNAAIKSLWNLEAYSLFPLSGGGPSHAPIHYQVAEICWPDTKPPTRMQWLSVVSLSSSTLADPGDLGAIQNSLTTLDQYRRGELQGIFGKPGWLRTVSEWVEAQAAAAGLRLTGKFRQLNASPTFSLIRFETDGPAAWFKAVGEPNLREFSISIELARLFPAFSPQVLAIRRDWNAWVSIEVAAAHLGASSSLDDWTTAATTLANLQIASLGNVLHLVQAGCKDMRSSTLLDFVDPFVALMGDIMRQQTKVSPKPLIRDELLALGDELKWALLELDEIGIPGTLGHLDFNPGNVLVRQERCVFLDWAEACVGHPFITFHYLLAHLRKLLPERASWESAITAAYVNSWASLVSREKIARSLGPARLVAVFAYAAAIVGLYGPKDLYPRAAAYLRSLTRHMKREADALPERSVTCPR